MLKQCVKSVLKAEAGGKQFLGNFIAKGNREVGLYLYKKVIKITVYVKNMHMKYYDK